MTKQTHTDTRDSADWLCLAAAPTFALMALLTGALGGGHADMRCLAAQSTFPFGGMVPMYLLMSAFHAPPWLTLMSRRRRAGRDRSIELPSQQEMHDVQSQHGNS